MNPAPPPVDVLSYAGTADPRRAPLCWRLALTVACIYLPYAWLVMDGYPWRDYRLYWIRMWPILPGLTAGRLLPPPPPDAPPFTPVGAMTLVGAGPVPPPP